MNAHARIIVGIVRKDVQVFWLFAIPLAALIVLQQFNPFETVPSAFAQILQILAPVASGLFMFGVVHEDAAASVRHDWLTRPIGALDMLTAKILFIGLTVFLPMVVGSFVAGVANGLALEEALFVAIGIRASVWVPTLACIAIGALTATMLQAAGTVVAGVLAALVLVTFSIRVGGMGEHVFVSGSGWLVERTYIAYVAIVSIVVLWLVYSRRQTQRARIIASTCAGMGMIAPALFSWPAVFGIQKALASEPAPDMTLRVECAQAGTRTRPASGEFSGDGEEPDRRKLEEEVFAMALRATASGVPESWKVMSGWIELEYLDADKRKLAQLRPLRYTADWDGRSGTASTTHVWVMNPSEYERLRAVRGLELHVSYSMSVLAPVLEIDLPADGARRHYAGIGFCSARRDGSNTQIRVDCFKAGTQPALLTAELVGASHDPGSRQAYPDYVPQALDFLGSERYVRVLPAEPMPAEPVVKVTTFEARTHFDRSVVLPGLTGPVTASCPASIQ